MTALDDTKPSALPVGPEPSRILVDRYERRVRKLRVSLLDACNFRCTYCMPVDAKFMSKTKWLQVDEIQRLVGILTTLGIEEVRLTGGEPTLRGDLIEIARGLSQLPLKLGLTTNGLLLGRILDRLRATNCQNLNISLDSLRPEVFAKLARVDGFDATMAAILRAKDLGFQVKINTVVMRGINDNELQEFCNFSRKYDIEVRFLELMAIGQAACIRPNHFMAASEILNVINQEFSLTEIPSPLDSTSVRYVSDSGVRIGMIAPVTKSFCGTCSRWRLTADGYLRACLMSTDGVMLRGESEERIKKLCQIALDLKPRGGLDHTPSMMHAIGG